MLNELIQGKSIPINDEYEVRLLESDDIVDIVEMLSEPEVTQYLFFAPSPVEVYQGYFAPLVEVIEKAREQNELPESVVLTVLDKTSGEFAGDIGLAATMLCPGNFEIGFQIPRPAWGKGIATAGAALLTDIAFKELAAHKVNADLYGGNTASARVLEKIGYTKEGQLKDYYKTGSGMDDKVFYGLTKEQYLARN